MPPKSKSRRKGPWVISESGERSRFLRGVITHDLVQRGLDFDEAYAVAKAVRDGLSDRTEIHTTELREFVTSVVASRLGDEAAAKARTEPLPVASALRVVYRGQETPFSRGLLARSIHASGIELDRAYALVAELESDLRSAEVRVVQSSEVARRVGDLLEKEEGVKVARRYRLIRRIRQLPRPLVIYVGGASGTGKSTLSLELAPLLRIYRINATDTIRQVMRMLFSPQILPAIHESSFTRPPAGLGLAEELMASDDEDPQQQLVTGFMEQSARIGVGVRAVVERAIAENMNVLVEGIHLVPPIVPFADLEGACYQVPIVLATPDLEAHRTRFLTRARLGGRRAERYLEHFAEIRTLHDFILDQAEAEDVPYLDTTRGESAPRTLRLITSILQQQVPSLVTGPDPEHRQPTLLLIIDGLADRPVRALGGRTPLQAAETPVLDRLASEGSCGLADAVAPGVVPDTAAGSLALFGQSPAALKRGPVEALGTGLKLRHTDVALRGNFATIDDSGQVVDRRAGRIRADSDKLAAALDRMTLPGSLDDEIQVRVAAATEHRIALVLRGEGLSSAISGSDPGDGNVPAQAVTPAPVDPRNDRAVYTARVVSLVEQEARRILADHPVNGKRRKKNQPPANAILTRGAGAIHRLIPPEEAGVPLRIACVAGDRTILGLARWLDATTIHRKKMTANLDTDLKAKFESAGDALEEHDLVVLHVKGADIAAHDQRPELKAEFLQKIDKELGKLLERFDGDLRVAVASDHATLSESGQHAADPVPVLLWGEDIEADVVDAFDETSVAAGSLQRFPLQMLLGRLFDLA
ncbi:MAG: 2,3-bisphosphoglycerate-independent phosphoglycerate mutase [Thermoanaerobaculia bacterium]|nr:2,3-bisphosphoglycerate-independent phosphoglycerate mutase [Thermoanaerobaculia bacterium]